MTNVGLTGRARIASFLLLWILATAAASGVVFLMSYWLAALLFGAILGAAQSLLLRQRISSSRWWIPANAAGWPLALAATYLLQFLTRKAGVRDVGIPAYSAVAGAAIGFIQWLVLRRAVCRAAWWIPASAVGWGAAFTAGVYLASHKIAPPVVAGTVSGAIGGAITGFVLQLMIDD